jgi:hypothetical protein
LGEISVLLIAEVERRVSTAIGGLRCLTLEEREKDEEVDEPLLESMDGAELLLRGKRRGKKWKVIFWLIVEECFFEELAVKDFFLVGWCIVYLECLIVILCLFLPCLAL